MVTLTLQKGLYIQLKYWNFHDLFLPVYYGVAYYIINQLTFSDLTLHQMPTYYEMEEVNILNMSSSQDVF